MNLCFWVFDVRPFLARRFEKIAVHKKRYIVYLVPEYCRILRFWDYSSAHQGADLGFQLQLIRVIIFPENVWLKPDTVVDFYVESLISFCVASSNLCVSYHNHNSTSKEGGVDPASS
jgi:hypothetical protein